MNTAQPLTRPIMAIPPGLPEGSPVDVCYNYDKDQRMNCMFEHKESGQKLVLNIDLESGTSSAETLEVKKAKVAAFTIDGSPVQQMDEVRQKVRVEDFIVE